MYEIKVEAEKKNLYKILDCLDELFDENHCNEEEKIKLNIAIEEIFINIVNYAYTSDKGYVTIRFQLNKDNLQRIVKIQFIDRGIKYNPLDNEKTHTDLVAQSEIGGLGILIVKNIMDKTEYEYSDGFNLFTIEKVLLNKEK